MAFKERLNDHSDIETTPTQRFQKSLIAHLRS